MKIEPGLGKKAVFFAITALIAFLTLTIAKASYTKEDDFSFVREETEMSPFLETTKNFEEETTEISFVDESSIVAVSSPLIYTKSNSLGTLIFDSEEERKEVKEYIVEEEETISSVAKKFNISVNTILWANKINNSSANVVGKKLIILPVSGVIHEVKKDESLGEIAKKYKADIEEIISFNELKDYSDVFIGDLLIIPNGTMPVIKPVTTQPSVSGFIIPTKGYISQGLHYYNAIDIANSCGTPIYAAAGGTIQITGYHSIGGNYIRIVHTNGVVTYYGHLSKILVSKDQKVSQGSLIGYMGNTGYTIGPTGCHLHFEVRGASNPLSKYKVGYKF